MINSVLFQSFYCYFFFIRVTQRSLGNERTSAKLVHPAPASSTPAASPPSSRLPRRLPHCLPLPSSAYHSSSTLTPSRSSQPDSNGRKSLLFPLHVSINGTDSSRLPGQLDPRSPAAWWRWRARCRGSLRRGRVSEGGSLFKVVFLRGGLILWVV